jgi:O-acetyl-ADP-ribose deacetylase (regulator of RNase III)
MLGIRQYKGIAIDLFQGDLTSFACDAMVNAANERLAGGGGVDGAIHRAGGPEITTACRQIGGCPTGQAVATTAGQLPAQKVIHTVGPVWRGGDHDEAALLRQAYQNSLAVAAQEQCPHVAFPSLSTGAYGFPVDQAASIAMQAVREALDQGPQLRRITFVLWSRPDYEAYQQALFTTFPETSTS